MNTPQMSHDDVIMTSSCVIGMIGEGFKAPIYQSVL